MINSFTENIFKEIIKNNYNAKIANDGIYLIISSDIFNSSYKEIFDFLKNNEYLKFSSLMSITAVDYPEKDKRFEVIYNLLSLKFANRLIIKIAVDEGESLNSINDIFLSANWFEREVFDMYGINFNNHPNMKRILNEFEFNGYPLRRDFPMTGFKEIRYNPSEREIEHIPVDLEQDYRYFDNLSPWSGYSNQRESANLMKKEDEK